MITINLLPTQKKRKASAEGVNVFLTFFLAGAFALAAVGATVYFSNEMQKKIKEGRQLDKDIKEIASRVEMVETKQKQLDALKQREKLLTKLLYSGPEWARVFNQISDLRPGKIWLENIEIKDAIKRVTEFETRRGKRVPKYISKKVTILTLTGATQDLDNGFTLVADFVNRLENSPFMKNFTGEISIVKTEKEKWLARGSEQDAEMNVCRFVISMEVNKNARKPAKKKKTKPRVASADRKG
jgi:Tfp pilus assembly protein PilN